MTPAERQSAIYRCEGRVLGPISRVFDTRAEAETYLEELAIRMGLSVPDVAWKSSSARVAHGSEGQVWLPNNKWGRSLAVILHEYAHHLVGGGHGHDGVWLSRYMKLVRSEMGFLAWAEFKNCLVMSGVQA